MTVEDLVEVIWIDKEKGLQRFYGTLQEDNLYGCSLNLPRLPKKRTRVCIDQDGARRWAQVRFSGWDAGRLKVGLEFDGAALPFLE